MSSTSSGARGNLLLHFRSVAPCSMPPISSTLPYFLWWPSCGYPWSPHLSSRPFHHQFYPVPSWISYFCHHLRQALGTVLPSCSSVLCPPPSWLPSFSDNTGALSRWVGCCPLSVKPSIIFHAFRFSPPPPLPSPPLPSTILGFCFSMYLLSPTFYHIAPPPPQRMHHCTASSHPPLFLSLRLDPHTSSLPEPD